MNENTNVDLKTLNAFLRKNKSVDFRKADLRHKTRIKAYKWAGPEAEKESLLKQLKSYQRLLRVLPNDNADLAKALLKKGINSALQIAGMPRKTFIKDNLKIFGGDTGLTERVYQRALACRRRVTLEYMNRSQRSEPHARAAGLHL